MPLPLDVTQQLIWTCGFVLPSSHDKHVLYATPGKGFTKDMYTWTSNLIYIYICTYCTHLWMMQYISTGKTYWTYLWMTQYICKTCNTFFFNWGHRFINMIYDRAFIPIVAPLLICYILSTCINIFSSIQGCCFGEYNRDVVILQYNVFFLKIYTYFDESMINI